MSLFITSLNSGSNGNCYYIGNENEAVLIDAGISCREVEKRMGRLGLNTRKIKAIFISHEHTDHIKGIPGLAKKYQLPVYITSSTYRGSGLALDENHVKSFTVNEPVVIGNLTIVAFSKIHDACDPCSFVVSNDEVKVGVFTDIGSACKNVISYFKKCHAAFLEANYDTAMLNRGSYPYYLKKRISGGKGHLSNHEALSLFKTHRPVFMSHLLLSHLSENNNCADVVKDLFTKHAGKVETIVASRFKETPVYHIKSQDSDNRHNHLNTSQLSFSFI